MGLSRPKLVALAVAVAAAAALAQSGYTYTVNGKKVSIETIERNGKVYVEASAAFKALGASVTFDKAKKSFVVVTAGQNQAQAVQGTTQLAGGEGALGKTYTLGKDNQALNFTLDSAEFSVTRVTMGGYVYAPKPNEKLLILRFTVQNPTKSEARLAYHSFKMTAVDATDINHEMDSYIAREGTSDIIDVALKPAQKIQAYSVIKVPAAGPIPKLIVARGSGSNTPVVRYDLRGKVKALTAPFAETTDASGVTAAETVTAKAGTYYPGKNFDLKLDSVAFSSEPMD
ncbi:MAG TPA: hypothetical protein VNT60_01550, partial [Deinococcales bacterium]|nr:hypothetical protein [Deinococcales bacterium]